MSKVKEILGEFIVPITDVIPYETNPKIHDAAQIKLLAEHIQEVGFDQPIVVDEHGVIIKGHGRLEALKYIGATTALIKVRKDLTDAQKKAARVADNKLAELAADHDEYLRAELQDLAAMDVDLKGLGFDNVRLTELKIDMMGLNSDEEKEVKNSGKELDLEDFEEFDNQCPKCSFEWNDKND